MGQGTVYENWTFEADDQTRPETKKLREYVASWGQVRTDRLGLMISGENSTGKTVAACMAANYLLDMGVSVIMTTIQAIVDNFYAAGYGTGRGEYLSKIQRVDLLIIDNYCIDGVKDYVIEQLAMVIEARNRSGKPLIITTTHPPAVFNPKNTKNSYLKDVNSRVQAMCSPIIFEGDSRRAANGLLNFERLKKMIGINTNTGGM
jgi:DNA replication protein DnaC